MASRSGGLGGGRLPVTGTPEGSNLLGLFVFAVVWRVACVWVYKFWAQGLQSYGKV